MNKSRQKKTLRQSSLKGTQRSGRPKQSAGRNTTRRTDGASTLPKQFPPLKPWIETLVIVAFSLAVYLNTLHHGYALDDTMMITHNGFTQQGFQGLGKILTNDAFTGFHGEDRSLLPGGRYRPLSQMMFAVEYALFGMNPFPGHLINVLLYALGCVLLLKAMRLMFAANPITLWRLSLPFVITLLFALHPLHTEGVANIKGRDEILGLIGFALLAIYALRYERSQQNKWLYLLPPLMVLSILAKESALTYLAAIPLITLYRAQRLGKTVFKVLAALSAGVILYVIARLTAVGVPPATAATTELLNNPFLHASPAERLATVLFTWMKYLQLIIFPHPLTHDYYPWHITYKSFGHPMVLASILFFGGMALYAIRKLPRLNIPATGFLLFIILFSSQSNLLVNIGAFMNERFVFVALLGFMMWAGWLLAGWLPRRFKAGTTVSLILLALMVSGYSAKTIHRNKAWKDDYTLFTTDVHNSPNSAKVNISAGGKMTERASELDDLQQRERMINSALTFLRRGVELHPAYLQGHLVLGNALFHLHNYTGAADAYRDALKVSPTNSDALKNLSLVGLRLKGLNGYPQAEGVYRTLLQHRPGEFEDAIGLAESLLNTGAYDEASAILDSLHRVDKDHAQLNHLLGQLWGRYRAFGPGVSAAQHRQYMNKAKDYLKRAADIQPESFSIIENLAIVHGILGETGEALRLFEQAIDMFLEREEPAADDPVARLIYRDDLARLYRNTGDTYRNVMNTQNALRYYHLALNLTPNDPSLVTMVAEMHIRAGELDEAALVLERYLLNNPQDQRVSEMLERLLQ